MITRLSIALEDFLGSSIASQVMPPCATQSKNFPDHPKNIKTNWKLSTPSENFQAIQKLSRPSRKYPEYPKTFQAIQNFAGYPETFRTIQKISKLSNFRGYAQKLSEWQFYDGFWDFATCMCHHGFNKNFANFLHVVRAVRFCVVMSASAPSVNIESVRNLKITLFISYSITTICDTTQKRLKRLTKGNMSASCVPLSPVSISKLTS